MMPFATLFVLFLLAFVIVFAVLKDGGGEGEGDGQGFDGLVNSVYELAIMGVMPQWSCHVTHASVPRDETV